MSLGESAWYRHNRAAFKVRRSREQSPMFMSVVSREFASRVYPELAGARVMITGLTAVSGVDVARAFAEHKARLVVQSPEQSPEITALTAVLAETAAEIKLFNDPFLSADEAVSFAQGAAQEYGGLDAVINLVSLASGSLGGRASLADVEALISEMLLGVTLMTRVVANRMRLTWSEGSILNVVTMGAPVSDREAALADVGRATLAALTRGEAKAWSEHGIRVNAIGPCSSVAVAPGGASLASDADIAALALYLASKKGRGLSGQVFDAEGVAARRC
jgi:3-oxoacyl-[acyl-carrier protein] reductase